MWLSFSHDQARARPLPHGELEILQLGAEAAGFFADLAGQGHGVAPGLGVTVGLWSSAMRQFNFASW